MTPTEQLVAELGLKANNHRIAKISADFEVQDCYEIVRAKWRFLLGLDRVETTQLRLVSRLNHYV